jgi:hypothetical protein
MMSLLSEFLCYIHFDGHLNNNVRSTPPKFKAKVIPEVEESEVKGSKESRTSKSTRLDSDDEEPLSGFEVDSEEEAVHLTDQVTRYVLSPHTIFIPPIITWF